LGPLGHWGPLFKITNDEIFPIFNNCVVQKYRFECQIYSIFGTQKRFWGNYIRTMCYVFHNNSQCSVLSFYVSTHKFSIELIFGSSRTNMVGMSSSCMPHTFSVDSECVMFYHNKSQCLVFSFMFLHIKIPIEVIFAFISSQKYEYLFVLLISLLLHSIDQHCFCGPGLVWICFQSLSLGFAFFLSFLEPRRNNKTPKKKERGPFAPVISAKSAPPTHAPQSALAQVAGQGSSCVIRVLSLSWQGLGGLSLLRDLSTLDLSLVAGFGKPCLCPQ